MKEKVWKDCPACGAHDSMSYRSNLNERVEGKGYKTFIVHGLDGYICRKCNDGILTIKSENRLRVEIMENRARQDSARVPASALIPVDVIAQSLKVPRQTVHWMMRAGRMPFVYVGKQRFPFNDKSKRIWVKGKSYKISDLATPN
ncbi:MAG: hypothetical protein LDLANPLL_01457 [Turneriella sp.]|nr:hypothetical protein [Turneriella sp.]